MTGRIIVSRLNPLVSPAVRRRIEASLSYPSRTLSGAESDPNQPNPKEHTS